MAIIPSIKRILKEDFRDVPWIDKLILPLNSFMGQVVNALNKGLTFEDNFNASLKELNLDPSELPLTIPAGLATKAKGLLIVKVYKTSDSDPTVGSACTPEWLTKDSDIIITSLPGLTPGSRYQITFLIF